MIDVDFLVGETVAGVVPRGDALWLVLREGGGVVPELYASLTAPISYVDPAGTSHQIDPTTTSTELVRASIGLDVVATSVDGGTLGLIFADDARLICPPDDQYEAWEVVGGYPLTNVICCPGGDLACVDARNPSFTVTPGEDIIVNFTDGSPPVPLARLRAERPEDAAKLDEMLELRRMPRPRGFPPAGENES